MDSTDDLYKDSPDMASQHEEKPPVDYPEESPLDDCFVLTFRIRTPGGSVFQNTKVIPASLVVSSNIDLIGLNIQMVCDTVRKELLAKAMQHAGGKP